MSSTTFPESPSPQDSDLPIDSSVAASLTDSGLLPESLPDGIELEAVRAEIQAGVRPANKPMKAKDIFGRSAAGGRVYRHGVAAAIGAGVPLAWELLTRMAVNDKPIGIRRKQSEAESLADWEPIAGADQLVADWLDEFRLHDQWTPLEASRAILFAATLPGLQTQIQATQWTALVASLIQLHQQSASAGKPDSTSTLMLGGELGLTLAWRLDSRHRKQWLNSAARTVSRWTEHFESAESDAVSHHDQLRLVVASLCRIELLAANLSPKKKKRKNEDAKSIDCSLLAECVRELAVWMIGTTRRDGGTVLSPASRDASPSEWSDDLGKGGLFDRVTALDPESFGPAIAATLGKARSGGRLAWQVSLPEAMLHDEQAGRAILMPDWDVRRGRFNLDYSTDTVQCELVAGRKLAFQGELTTQIMLDSVPQHSEGDWSISCEYSDDDVHFVEIEQPWSNGLMLQRQFLTLRDERAAYLADAIVPVKRMTDRWAKPISDRTRLIEHEMRIPIGEGLIAQPEPETREIFLADDRRQALIVPLSGSEWRNTATPSTLDVNGEHLVWKNQGRGRLYAPMWCDMLRRRFKRPRTWRTLTVADQLEICPSDVSTAYRIQSGSSQWVFYRSLAGNRLRTFLGKHIMADFIAARFDTGDGVFEELVTVEADD